MEGDRSSYELYLAGTQNALRLHAPWAHRVHIVHTPCAQRLVLVTGAVAGALQVQQGRAQKMPPGANVFSWRFCTRTSSSRQLNRYGWRATGLQRSVRSGPHGL